MMYSSSFSIGERRLCWIANPEKPDARKILGPVFENPKAQEKMGGWSEIVRNFQDVIKAFTDALKGIRNEPHMPRMKDGKPNIPALDGLPGSDDPEVRAELERALDQRYNGPKARTYFQRYPERYSRMQPPAPERMVRRGSPLRTGFNRTDGRYYEIWDASTQSYVKGPILQTFEQMQAEGTRNRRARAEDEAQRRAALIRMRDWDKNRQDPIHGIRAAQRRMWASVGEDPNKYVGGSFRDGDKAFAADMEKFDRENPVYMGQKEELTFEQSKSFKELMTTEGIPHNVREDMKWWNDAAGSLIVWQRKGNAWEGVAIQRSGITSRLGTSEQAPTVEQVTVAPAVEAVPSAAPRMNRERMANGFEQVRRETYIGMNNARLERGQQPFASFEQYNVFKTIARRWDLNVEHEANGIFRSQFNGDELEIWKKLPDGMEKHAKINAQGRVTVEEIIPAQQVPAAPANPDVPSPSSKPLNEFQGHEDWFDNIA